METLKYRAKDGEQINSIEFNINNNQALYESSDEDGFPVRALRTLTQKQWTAILHHHIEDKTMAEYSTSPRSEK